MSHLIDTAKQISKLVQEHELASQELARIERAIVLHGEELIRIGREQSPDMNECPPVTLTSCLAAAKAMGSVANAGYALRGFG